MRTIRRVRTASSTKSLRSCLHRQGAADRSTKSLEQLEHLEPLGLLELLELLELVDVDVQDVQYHQWQRLALMGRSSAQFPIGCK